MRQGVTPETREAALDATPQARAAMVVSPTYYGLAADVAALADVAHARDVPLIVDQSWGPHFGFHPGVPASALHLGADAAVTSTHKIVGSLTQSADRKSTRLNSSHANISYAVFCLKKKK